VGAWAMTAQDQDGTLPMLARSHRKFWKTSPVVVVVVAVDVDVVAVVAVAAVVVAGGIVVHCSVDLDWYDDRKKTLKNHTKYKNYIKCL
jgi:predicted class III extradiol MEMO1 family dioxygenase